MAYTGYNTDFGLVKTWGSAENQSVGEKNADPQVLTKANTNKGSIERCLLGKYNTFPYPYECLPRTVASGLTSTHRGYCLGMGIWLFADRTIQKV